MNGGYFLIDCTGLDLNSPGTVSGIYDNMLKAYDSGKLVLLGGIKNSTAAYTPVPVFLYTALVSTDTVVKFTIGSQGYTVADNDSVTADV